MYLENGLSLNEMLSEYLSKINECVNLSNESVNLCKWLVDVGLSEETNEKLNTLLADGTIGNLINETILNGINTKVDDITQQNNGKKIKNIACVLRNVGSGFYAINDANHNPLNITTVTTNADSIVIDYGFVASKVLSLVVTPDETLAQLGYVVGASVSLDKATIKLSKQDKVYGYLTKSGGANPVWTLNESISNGITGISWDNTSYKIIITHDKCYNPIPNIFTRDPDVTAYPRIISPEGGFTTTQISFKTNVAPSGVIIPPDGTVVCFSYNGSANVPPADVIEYGSNLWVFGLMEVN